MTLHLNDTEAVISGECLAEEAENLLTWLQVHPESPVNLSECLHIHPACLQVLMAANANLAGLPADPILATLLQKAIFNPTAKG
jgi:hypothetical protein